MEDRNLQSKLADLEKNRDERANMQANILEEIERNRKKREEAQNLFKEVSESWIHVAKKTKQLEERIERVEEGREKKWKISIKKEKQNVDDRKQLKELKDVIKK